MTSHRTVQLVAVQPRIALTDYTRPGAFREHHRALAALVAARRRPGVPALAVWPEMVAAFLPVTGYGAAIAGCRTTDQALRRVALRRLPALVAAMGRHRTLDLTRAFLAAAAPRVFTAYVDTFAGIARDFDLWVVAGSALLPRNALGDGSPAFRTLRGPAGAEVFNTSMTFAPDGRIAAVTRKVNLVPTQEDVLHLSAGRVEELPVVDTPFGRLGTVICYDGFHEAHTEHEPGFTRCAAALDARAVTVLAQPSANAWAWDAPWAFNAPDERLLRREQWFAEGLTRELAELRHVRVAVNPQLVGQVLDNSFEAPSLILARQADGGVSVLAQADSIDEEEVLDAVVELPATG